MKNLIIQPGSPLNGEISLAGDKSISHRAIILASLAEGKSTIRNPLLAGVTEVMLACLPQLGIDFQLTENKLEIWGKGLKGYQSPSNDLYCGNSATTIRLLAGAIAGSGVDAVLTGSEGLQKRPMNRIIKPLTELGANISGTEGNAPLTLSDDQELIGTKIALEIASAQVKSSVLFAALQCEGVTTLKSPGTSRDHSEKMLAHMGVTIEQSDLKDSISITPPTSLKPLDITIPGDISSAAFLIVGALITPGSKIAIKNVGLNATRTGILDVLKQMGANIKVIPIGESFNEPYGDVEVSHSDLHGIEISGDTVVRMIDEFPAFAIAAFFAKGTSTVMNAKELRYKETDRIAVICKEFGNLDIDIIEKDDGFIINGGQVINGGVINSHDDHRIAMAGAILGLAAISPVEIHQANIINESFPNFHLLLNSLGASAQYSNSH